MHNLIFSVNQYVDISKRLSLDMPVCTKKLSSLIAIEVFFLSLLVSCSNGNNDICNEIKPIAQNISTTLQSIAQNFGNSYNDKLAEDLAKLRKLNSSDASKNSPKLLLENSIQQLMSDLNSSDFMSASRDVDNMTTAIQSLLAVCQQ